MMHSFDIKPEQKRPILAIYTMKIKNTREKRNFRVFQESYRNPCAKLLVCPTAKACLPWLLNMQRYGPPKAYPNLKLPGVNAALPDGAQYGFHAGGWGQPPLDVNGKPMWGGDIFGGFGNTSDGVAGSGKSTAMEMSRLSSIYNRLTQPAVGVEWKKRYGTTMMDESENEEGASNQN